jgi:hypothetical protein
MARKKEGKVIQEEFYKLREGRLLSGQEERR